MMKGPEQHCPVSSVRPLQWCKIARAKLTLAHWLGCLTAGAAPWGSPFGVFGCKELLPLAGRKCVYLEMFLVVSEDLILA